VITTCDISSLYIDDQEQDEVCCFQCSSVILSNTSSLSRVCSRRSEKIPRSARSSFAPSRSGSLSTVSVSFRRLWLLYWCCSDTHAVCLELTDSYWAGSVRFEVSSNPAYMKVCMIMVLHLNVAK
jgi:hypothetical protein